MINYEINSIQEFEVDRSQGIEEDFFRLIVDEGNVYFLPKLKFQLAEPLPQTLKVKIKSCNKSFWECWTQETVSGTPRNL